jgi:tRNA U34 2-thiouridine synthase MnmA/TrmU
MGPTRAQASALRDRISQFITGKLGAPTIRAAASTAEAAPAPVPPAETVDFVAEDDVRRALQQGRTIALAPGAIVTPSARDLAAGQRVLIQVDG